MTESESGNRLDEQGQIVEQPVYETFWSEHYSNTIYPRLIAFSRYLLTARGNHNYHDAEDAVTAGIIRFFDYFKVETLAPVPPTERINIVWAYLYASVRSAVQQLIRDAAKSGAVLFAEVSFIDAVVEEGFNTPGDAYMPAHPRVAAFRRLLAQLKPEDCEILTLKLGDQLTFREIVWYYREIKGAEVKISALKMRCRRALKKLYVLLNQMPEFANDLEYLKERFGRVFKIEVSEHQLQE